jgi:hypothetical protein
VSRVTRLSARAYGRLTPERKDAVDQLEWFHPDAAGRGEAKTVLGWRRTQEETIAYARQLLGEGMIVSAVASRLRVGERYLRRLLPEVPDLEKRPRNRSIYAGNVALTDRGKGLRHPSEEQTAP